MVKITTDGRKMKMAADGTFTEFHTHVGEFTFKDVNDTHHVSVETDGEFWRGVQVYGPKGAVLPAAEARALAKLLNKAAKCVDREEARIKKVDAALRAKAKGRAS